jgi:AcrR family transcriptional regulator
MPEQNSTPQPKKQIPKKRRESRAVPREDRRKQATLDDSLRHPVKQDRSVRRVSVIEDAIRQLLRDPAIGRDRFTTAQVAVLAGCAVGTVYRYFPDRLAMLDRVWPDRPGSYLPDEQPPSTP